MKVRVFKSMASLLFATLLSTSFAFAQVGPVVSISETQQSLPKDIKVFLNRYFPTESIQSIQLKTLLNVYDIELNNGYDLKLLSTGQWLEVEAPDKATLSESILRSLLPETIYKHLKEKRALRKVKDLHFNPQKGYKADLKKDKTYCFDLNGKPIKKSHLCDQDKEHRKYYE
ncbi:MAG: PepSY-like domain-containing protein [Bacteroides sp.]|uniref:PepSY-like domain-containing protein n=1 Tax=Bacteroides sp. TaxID=29523 RepID=UPI002FC8C8A7